MQLVFVYPAIPGGVLRLGSRMKSSSVEKYEMLKALNRFI